MIVFYKSICLFGTIQQKKKKKETLISASFPSSLFSSNPIN